MARRRLTIKNYFQETHLFTRRIFVLLFVILASTTILIVRLAFLQIEDHDLYTTLSNQNQLSLIPLEPNRGLIYDRNGVLLAENIPIFSLDVTPDHVPDMTKTIAGLKKFIDITPADLKRFRKELREHRPFQTVSLKVKLSEDEVAKFYVNQYRFPGVTINAGLSRHYPYGKQFVSVLGYVARINEQEMKEIDEANYSGSNTIGKIGIEKFYEKELHGTVGYKQVEVDANGRYVRTLKLFPPIRGDNLYLTIDSRLQTAIENIMQDEKGAIVAINPKTGEVLALVSCPSYDPNPFVIGIDPEAYRMLRNSSEKPLYNRAIRGIYPFASTIKPFLAIAALDSNTITTDYRIYCAGSFSMPGVRHIYRDWRKGHGSVNLPKAITVSCDTFFYGLAVKLGINRMHNYLNKFGFGQKTGIDVLEELAGLNPSPEWKLKKLHAKWFIGDTIVAGIGQGYMLTTPLQLAQGAATIANYGIRYQPRLLSKLEKPDNTVEELKPIRTQPLILKNPKTWDIVINAMVNVTSTPHGTAAAAFNQVPYEVAGKTGTAQLTRIVGENIHGSDASLPKNLRNHKLFIAFAPVDDPILALAVIVENNNIAPKVARQIFDYYFLQERHYIPPGYTPPPVITPTNGSTMDQTQTNDKTNDNNKKEESNINTDDAD
jgi:penicillin-binding protein 2